MAVIIGTTGADTLVGGAPGGLAVDDTLDGGLGPDSYRFAPDHGSDLIRDQGGSDEIRFGPGVAPGSVRLGRDADDLVVSVVNGVGRTLSAIRVDAHFADPTHRVERIVFDDGTVIALTAGLTLQTVLDQRVLVGTDRGDTLIGGAGTDTLAGALGDDVYRLGSGLGLDIIADTGGARDVVALADLALGTTLRLALGGGDLALLVVDAAGVTVGGAVMQGAAVEILRVDGRDFALGELLVPLVADPAGGRLVLRPTDTTLLAGAGDDVIVAAFGPVVIDGGDGADRITTGRADDFVFGGAGADVIRTGGGSDFADGGDGDDTILGFVGAQILRGGAGDDSLVGGTGDDTLEGGSGADRLRGDPGRDLFVFRDGFGQDRVLDFRPGSDRLDFSAHGGVDTLADLTLRASGTAVVIEDGAGGRLVLAGVALSQLAPDDFLF